MTISFSSSPQQSRQMIDKRQARKQLRLKDCWLLGVSLFLAQLIYFHLVLVPKQIGSQEATTLKKSKKSDQPPTDGTFNGYPIYLQKTAADDPPNNIYSQIHCIGETNERPFWVRKEQKYVDTTWMHRSCHFQFLCFDVEEREFVIYQDPNNQSDVNNNRHPLLFSNNEHADVSQTILSKNNNHTSDSPTFGVSIGGINRDWTMKGIPRLRWFPHIRYEAVPSQFYTLPADVVLVPFHSLAGHNPGHLVWDDFLPIYTLLQLFQLDHQELLLLRYQILNPALWASCDDRASQCESMLRKFGPLLLRNSNTTTITTQNNVQFTTTAPNQNNYGKNASSNLVCARHGVAGLGSLTDHGVTKGHGLEFKDYQTTHNHGRGGQLWRFRNFMLSNLGLEPDPTTTTTTTIETTTTPLKIIFSSQHSSSESNGSLTFRKQIQALQQQQQQQQEQVEDVQIESHTMKDYSIHQQAELVRHAAIYVTGCGGGAATAMFLPKGASVIIYYPSSTTSTTITGKKKKQKNRVEIPTRLDWDLFNNLAYTRVHWIHYKEHEEEDDVDVTGFVALIQHELNIVRRERGMLSSKET